MQGLFYCEFTNLVKLNNTPRYFFKRESKLKSRKIIQQVFAEGKSFTIYPIKAIWLPSNEVHFFQTGISVSSRYFKKAVDRNKIKRLIREAHRLQKNSLEEHLQKNKQNLSLFLIYIGKEIPTYTTIVESCASVLKKIIKLTNEES